MKKENPLVDAFGRQINYLRISLTEACNFKCVYCEPPQGVAVQPSSEYLSVLEIKRFSEIISRLGVYRIRLTGGEPLLRRDIVDIVHTIKTSTGIQDLSLTTNASRLKEYLKPLKKAGLDRINISLDSVEKNRFKDITRSSVYEEVYASVFLALKMGFPVKLNMVVLQGLSRDEIIRYVRLAKDYPLEVRFLEYMPLCGTAWDERQVVPIQQVREIVQEHFLLEHKERGDSVAESFNIQDGQGQVGFIASLTESFCDTCSRIRLSADGNIFPCLFSKISVSVRDLLRNGATDEEIIQAIRMAVSLKPEGNVFQKNPFTPSGNQSDINNHPLIKTLGG